MQLVDYLRFIFCRCCQSEQLMFSSSISTQTNCLEKKDDIFKNDSDYLIPPGSSQIKYTFALEDSSDSDSLSVVSTDSTDSYSSQKTNTSIENNHDIMRTSFGSNESWEIMIENNHDYLDNIKYV